MTKESHDCLSILLISCCSLDHISSNLKLVASSTKKESYNCFSTVLIFCCCLDYISSDLELVILSIKEESHDCFSTAPVFCCCLDYISSDLELVTSSIEKESHNCFSTVPVSCCSLDYITSDLELVASHLEHIRSLRPSAVTNIYFLFTLIFDLARLRTLFTLNASPFVAGCFASMTVLKAIVLVAEATEKRRLVLDWYCNLSPEETSGIYSRSFFIWLNPLMITGFRRFLNDKNLYPIDREMSSVILRQKIEKAWKNASKGTSRALFWAVLRSNFKPLILCIIPRLLQISFRYAQPFLLTRMISFANDLSQSDNIGWGLAGAFFFVLLGLAVSNGWYYHMTYRFVTSTRGSLISVIYMKTVNLSITAIDESVAVTLMSSDAQTICNGFETIHEFWAVPDEIADCE